MTENLHERARDLALTAWLEELPPPDATWLRSHLNDCAECAHFAAAISDGVGALRAAPLQADTALVEATKRSVRIYAARVRENQSRVRMLAISCVLSVIWGGVSLPWLWRAFAWLGEAMSLPGPVWQMGFVLFWMAPSAAVAVLLLAPRYGSSGWAETGSR